MPQWATLTSLPNKKSSNLRKVDLEAFGKPNSFDSRPQHHILLIRWATRKSHYFLIILVSLASLLELTKAPLGIKYPHNLPWNARFKDCQPLDFACHSRRASLKFEILQAAQSVTLDQAVAKYKYRYKREPPPGFDLWFEYASANGAQLIDEYDQLDADMEPFRKFSASQLNSRIDSALVGNKKVTEGRRLGLLEIKSGALLVEGFSFQELSNATVYEMIKPVLPRLPDLRLLINWFPQPRVLGSKLSSEQEQTSNEVIFQDRSGRDNWDLLRNSCPANYLTRSETSSDRDTLDVCKLADHQRKHHGMFVAPTYFYPTESLVPIASRGKLSTMRDILVPNPCYWADRYRLTSHPDVVPLNEKRWSVYWRGQTTGIILRNDTIFSSQRMRFVNLLNMLQELVTEKASQDSSKDRSIDAVDRMRLQKAERLIKAGEIRLKAEEAHAISLMPPTSFDVAFDRVYKADHWDTKRRTMKVYPFKPSDAATSMYEHQFVADIDGESMSCRFYAQLESGSVPLKQTLFAEWHDDRLVPWLHYIPISTSYDEVPTLLLWLQTAQGQAVAQRISKTGQAWAKKSLRRVDMTIYYYRLFLEYARIFNEKNGSMK